MNETIAVERIQKSIRKQLFGFGLIAIGSEQLQLILYAAMSATMAVPAVISHRVWCQLARVGDVPAVDCAGFTRE